MNARQRELLGRKKFSAILLVSSGLPMNYLDMRQIKSLFTYIHERLRKPEGLTKIAEARAINTVSSAKNKSGC